MVNYSTETYLKFRKKTMTLATSVTYKPLEKKACPCCGKETGLIKGMCRKKYKKDRWANIKAKREGAGLI